MGLKVFDSVPIWDEVPSFLEEEVAETMRPVVDKLTEDVKDALNGKLRVKDDEPEFEREALGDGDIVFATDADGSIAVKDF